MDLYAIRESSGKDQHYQAKLSTGRAIPTGDGYGTYWSDSPHVSIWFATKPYPEKSQRFSIVIEPKMFAALASEMMKADPEAAIKAFGKAMQALEIRTKTKE